MIRVVVIRMSTLGRNDGRRKIFCARGGDDGFKPLINGIRHQQQYPRPRLRPQNPLSKDAR